MTTTQTQQLINDQKSIASITRTEITDNAQRAGIFSKYFPKCTLEAELLVYNWMARLCGGYCGGYWHIFELSNGGFYMALKDGREFETLCTGSGDSVCLSADAAGLVATLLAVNQIANDTLEGDIINLYFLILHFAAEHVEAAGIFRAIDRS